MVYHHLSIHQLLSFFGNEHHFVYGGVGFRLSLWACASERATGCSCFFTCRRCSWDTCQPGRERGIPVSLGLEPYSVILPCSAWQTDSALFVSYVGAHLCSCPRRGGFLCSLSPAVMGLHLCHGGFAALRLSHPSGFCSSLTTCTHYHRRPPLFPCSDSELCVSCCEVCGEKPVRGWIPGLSGKSSQVLWACYIVNGWIFPDSPHSPLYVCSFHRFYMLMLSHRSKLL